MKKKWMIWVLGNLQMVISHGIARAPTYATPPTRNFTTPD